MSLRIIEGNSKRAEDVAGELAERIKALIYEYEGRITVAAAVGVLAIVQAELIAEAKT